MVRTDARTDVTNGLTQYFWGALHNSPSGNNIMFVCQQKRRCKISRLGEFVHHDSTGPSVL